MNRRKSAAEVRWLPTVDSQLRAAHFGKRGVLTLFFVLLVL